MVASLAAAIRANRNHRPGLVCRDDVACSCGKTGVLVLLFVQCPSVTAFRESTTKKASIVVGRASRHGLKTKAMSENSD